MIEINITFVIQLINFVVILILINYVLIRPVRDIIQKRKAIRYELLRKAHEFADQATAETSIYEDALRTAREEGAKMRQALREEGLAQQAERIATANEQAATLFQQERERAAREAEQAGQALSGQIKTLADGVVLKLLA